MKCFLVQTLGKCQFQSNTWIQKKTAYTPSDVVILTPNRVLDSISYIAVDAILGLATEPHSRRKHLQFYGFCWFELAWKSHFQVPDLFTLHNTLLRCDWFLSRFILLWFTIISSLPNWSFHTKTLVYFTLNNASKQISSFFSVLFIFFFVQTNTDEQFVIKS